MNKITTSEIRQHLNCPATRCSCRTPSGNTHCPNRGNHKHGDKHPSLSITTKQDSNGSFVVFNCFVGCSYQEIIGALNIKSHQLRGMK